MSDKERASKLAVLMSDIGKHAGINIKVFITDMNQPLGNYIGNALEIKEAIEVLSGKGPEDLKDICISLSAGMLQLAGLGSYNECKILSAKALSDNSALNQFKLMINAQSGKLDDKSYPVLIDSAKYVFEIFSDRSGFITGFDTKNIGVASLVLGAGRVNKTDKIDPAAGIILNKKINDSVKNGEILATFFTNEAEKIDEAREIFLNSIKIGEEKIEQSQLVIEIID